MILADTGPLFALLNAKEPAHEAVTAVVRSAVEPIRVPSAVAVEVCYLLSTRIGFEAEANFLESIGTNQLHVEDPMLEDYTRAAALVRQYSESPLGSVDAIVIAMAERLNVTTLLTLDRRHFAAVRPRHCKGGFRLLPV